MNVENFLGRQRENPGVTSKKFQGNSEEILKIEKFLVYFGDFKCC